MTQDILMQNNKSKRKTIQGVEPKMIPNFLRPDPNPNGANQFLLDPRQIKMWGLYIDFKNTKTFANAYQSAILSGYTKASATNITKQEWFIEKARKSNLLTNSVKILDEVINTEHIVKKIGPFGPIIDPITKEYVYEVDTSILKLKLTAAIFTTERLGKNDGFSNRNEITGKDGKDLPIPILGGIPQREIDETNRRNL